MRDRHIVDTRIHACLYFVRPSGHSLKPIDVIVMKKLADVVNVIPVIAKADSMTLEEREKFKKTVRDEMRYHGIRSYPIEGGDYDQDEASLNEAINVSLCGPSPLFERLLPLGRSLADITLFLLVLPLTRPLLRMCYCMITSHRHSSPSPSSALSGT